VLDFVLVVALHHLGSVKGTKLVFEQKVFSKTALGAYLSQSILVGF